jgi:hypothetical protein
MTVNCCDTCKKFHSDKCNHFEHYCYLPNDNMKLRLKLKRILSADKINKL